MKKKCELNEVPLIANNFPSLQCVGGNVNNEYLTGSYVALYGAVVPSGISSYRLCSIGDYIAYKGEEKVIQLHSYIHFPCMHACMHNRL